MTPGLLLLFSLASAVVAHMQTHVARQSDSFFTFNTPNNLVSCASTLISWAYIGPNDSTLSLAITNSGVSQDGSTNLPTQTDRALALHRRDLIVPIAPSLQPTKHSYFWSEVTVPQGWYTFTALIQSIQSTAPSISASNPFFVAQQGDSSCLNSTTSSTSSSSTPAQTSSTVPTSSPSPSPSQSPTQTQTPVPISGSSTNVGAIAGGATAGAVVLITVLALYIFCVFIPRSGRNSRGRTPSSPSSKHPLGTSGGGRRSKGWGGLASVDSHTGALAIAGNASPPVTKKSRHQSQADSIATVATTTVEGGYGYGYNGSGGGGGKISVSQEDVQSYRSGPGSRSGSIAHHGYGHGHGHSISPSEEKLAGVGSDEMEMGVTTLAYGAPQQPQRRASLTSHGQLSPRRPSLDSAASVQSPVPPTLPLPPAGAGAGVPPPLQQSQQNVQRKTPRKPVPAYAAPSPSLSSSPPSSDSTLTSPSPLAPPPLDTGMGPGHYATRASMKTSGDSKDKSKSKSKPRSKSKDKPRSASRAGGGSSASGSTESVGDVGGRETVLAHKSSFGPGGVEGKPLHYLIPDILPGDGR